MDNGPHGSPFSISNQQEDLLILLTRVDEWEKFSGGGNYLSDIIILKSFDIPLSTPLENIFNGSPAHLLLKDRPSRPSPELWNNYIELLRNMGVGERELATTAAELYHSIKEKIHTPHQTATPQEGDPANSGDMYPPNITGNAIDGLGMSNDGKVEESTEEHHCT